jgi:hypothetical protein
MGMEPSNLDASLSTSDRVLRTLLAAFLSLIFAGAGQAFNRQWFKTVATSVAAFALWFVLLGWVVHAWAIADAGVTCWLRTGAGSLEGVGRWRATWITFVCFVLIVGLMMGASTLWIGWASS